jgi:hypothetical protein
MIKCRKLHFHAKEFLGDTLRNFGRVCTYIFCKLLFDGSMHLGYMITVFADSYNWLFTSASHYLQENTVGSCQIFNHKSY